MILFYVYRHRNVITFHLVRMDFKSFFYAAEYYFRLI